MDATPVFPPPPSYTSATTETARCYGPSSKRNDTPASRSSPGAIRANDIPTVREFRQQTSWRILPDSAVWKFIDEWWLWELLSWCFAAFCMGAIAVLLAVFEGRALPQWPLGLTINSYVSVLGAFVKAALLLPTAEALGQLKWNWFATESRDITDFQTFDEASRGPWGSFILIIKTRARYVRWL